ncbi:MAG: DHH family phosphoesterase [Oscillospiraceae bacterium]|nr:DHH family phosphoesterase [Oscillospiraceae bacterium]
MAQNITWKAAAVVAAVFVAAGGGGFYLGRMTALSSSKAETELNIRLNRSDLEYLDQVEGTILVTGHKSPDTDTVSSSMAYAALLRELGYDARPVVLGSINSETQYVLDAAGAEVPELLEDAAGCNMLLVDHSEYTQSAEGMQDANIIGIIDHHGDGSITTGSQLVYDARPLGATATIIWIRYRNYGIEPDRQTAMLLLGAILSDTYHLKSSTTTAADHEAVAALSKIAGMEDTDAFYDAMYRDAISYEGMSDKDIFYSDYKEYEAGSKKFSIGCVNAYDEEAAKDLAARMKPQAAASLAETGMDLAFVQITILHDDVSITYLVPCDDAADEVLETAFGDRAAADGTSYVLDPGISRKQVTVPAVTDVLNAYPKE